MKRQLTWFMLAVGIQLSACGNESIADGLPPEASAPDDSALPVQAEAVDDGSTTLYEDALGPGWVDWSWATHNLAATSPVASGSRAVSSTFGPWTGLYFHHPGVSTSGLEFLEFQVHGGATSNPALTAYATVGNQARPTVSINRYCDGGTIKAGAWTRCRVPLTALNVVNVTMDGIAIQEGAGRNLPVMTFDSVRLGTATLSAPSGLKAVASATDVSLTWNSVSGATGYHVYRATSQTGTYTKRTTTPLTNTTYRDTSVTAGATYWYAVSAVSAGGEGLRSTPVSATVKPPQPQVAISVTPTSASLAPGASRTFSATVTGSTNTAVTWSIQQGSAGGTITHSGQYTAPRTTGTYHVIATSQADTTKKATATVTVAATQPGSGKWVSGYYTGWNADLYPPEKVDFSALTHIIVGRVTPKPDGSLNAAFDNNNGPQIAKTLAQRAHAAGRKAIIMVGGAGEHAGWVAAASNTNRAKFVQNLLNVMDTFGYDGLDIDWEPVEAADKPNLLALVKELRAARPNMLLTFPIGWINSNFASDADPWFANLAPYLDQLNIMSYEMIGPWDGWQSWYTSALYGESGNRPTSVSSSLQGWARAGIPKAKLGMGIPFYGMAWRNITGPYQNFTHWSDYVGSDNSFTYKKIQQLSASGTYRWDAVAAASYVTFNTPVEDGTVRWISYDSPEAIAAKGAYARDNGFGGTIIWTLNQGCTNPTTGANPLLDAVKGAFLQ
ncbi:glycosyl hydrolase family 18 protein [Myxococcus xanthus]|uniref:glycosyl hydrolase family 18 protein n=1 Tax=Myxococcus xanthus TaxID=34 RepID=UPI001129A79B|nr:glycosyl hydrolase family 18 protein [Myxococcus xanthus]QDE95503.1 chitinase [Myxococcus xanthus]